MSNVIDQGLELYPDEVNRLKLICIEVNRKFIGKYNTLENMLAYGREVEGRCKDELGLVVDCDISAMKMGDDGEWYSCPEVMPIRRINPEAFDHEKAKREIQSGFADGVPGVITEDGRFVEPNLRIPVKGVELG